MRRFASCCTTEAHQLCRVFMARMSSCIFKWDSDDLKALCSAKSAELALLGVAGLADAEILRRLTKKELALHCRRVTRGADETTQLIDSLITSLDCDSDKDTMGCWT